MGSKISLIGVVQIYGAISHWHDDFTDIYNQRYGYRHHGKYDKNFKDAFNIVKNNIEKKWRALIFVDHRVLYAFNKSKALE